MWAGLSVTTFISIVTTLQMNTKKTSISFCHSSFYSFTITRNHLSLSIITNMRVPSSFSTIDCTKEKANFHEETTRGQSNSILWFDHKVGRITASIMGKVAKCQEKVFPNSLLEYHAIF